MLHHASRSRETRHVILTAQVRDVMRCAVAAAEVNDIQVATSLVSRVYTNSVLTIARAPQPFVALSSLFLGVLVTALPTMFSRHLSRYASQVHTALSKPHSFSLLSPDQTLTANAQQVVQRDCLAPICDAWDSCWRLWSTCLNCCECRMLRFISFFFFEGCSQIQ
jgi:hypothetical protein